MYQLTPWFDNIFYDTDGVTPLADGKVFTYVAGSTSTKKTTYKTAAGTANANPIVLSATGRCQIWLGSGLYKFVVAPANDTDPPVVKILTIDNVGVGSLGTASTSVQTIAALKDLMGMSTGDLVYVEGYLASGDGGGGQFYFNSSSSATADNGVIIQPAASSGRWYRIVGSEINVMWYGATGDGSTTDSAAIALAQTYASANGYSLFFPEGTFLCNNITLTVSARGQDRIKSIVKQSSDTSNTNPIFAASGSIEIKDMTLDGIKTTKANKTRNIITYSGTATTKLTVKNCYFTNSEHAAIVVTGDYGNADIFDSEITGMLEQDGTTMSTFAVYGTAVGNYNVSRCYIHQAAAPASWGNAPGGVRISGPTSFLNCSDNKFQYLGQNAAGSIIGAIDLQLGAKAIISNNKIDNCERSVNIQGSPTYPCLDNVITGNSISATKYGIDCDYGSFKASNNLINHSAGNYGIDISNAVTGEAIKINGGEIIGLVSGIYAATSCTYLSLEISGVLFYNSTHDINAVGCASVIVTGSSFVSNITTTSCTYVFLECNRSTLSSSETTTTSSTTVINRYNSWNDLSGTLPSGNTPSVSDYRNVYFTTTTPGTSITNFTNGFSGQLITIFFVDANTEINRGDYIVLLGGTTEDIVDSTSANCVSFINRSNVWYEIGRKFS